MCCFEVTYDNVPVTYDRFRLNLDVRPLFEFKTFRGVFWQLFLEANI